VTIRLYPLGIAGLASLACLNAWLFALALGRGVADTEAQAPVALADQPPRPPTSGLKLPNRKPAGAYSQTLAKPVFFMSRAPYVPPPPAPRPVAAPSAAPVGPGLTLAGVLIMEETRKAYIVNKGDARGAWLSEGETILVWKVESIDAMTARLQQAGRSIELQLYPRR
jgi:hypothetical protein